MTLTSGQLQDANLFLLLKAKDPTIGTCQVCGKSLDPWYVRFCEDHKGSV